MSRKSILGNSPLSRSRMLKPRIENGVRAYLPDIAELSSDDYLSLSGVKVVYGGKGSRRKIIPEHKKYFCTTTADLVIYTDGSWYRITQKYIDNPTNNAIQEDLDRLFSAYAFTVWNPKTDELLLEKVQAGQWQVKAGYAELAAVGKAIEWCYENCPEKETVILTDSEWVANSIGVWGLGTTNQSGWLSEWEANGYTKSDGHKVAYVKSWRRIFKLLKALNEPHVIPRVSVYHVGGHKKGMDAKNWYVDELVKGAMKHYRDFSLCHRGEIPYDPNLYLQELAEKQQNKNATK